MIIQDLMIVKSQKEIANNIFEMTLIGKLVPWKLLTWSIRIFGLVTLTICY